MHNANMQKDLANKINSKNPSSTLKDSIDNFKE